MDNENSVNQIFLRKITAIIHANLENENFGVKELAIAMKMSRSNIHRKLKAISKKSISKLICEIRLQKSMEMLKLNEYTVAEIAYKVGFGSPTYFNKCFHEYYGFPPGELKKGGAIIQNQQTSSNKEVSPYENTELITVNPILKNLKANYKRNIFVLSLLVVFIAILGFALNNVFYKQWFDLTSNRVTPLEKSIVVLPFKNLSNDINNQYLADGIMEDILNSLFRISELQVVSRTSGEHFRESELTIPEIARKLKVNYVLEGSMRIYNNKVRVIIQLIDARKDEHLWSQQFDNILTDILSFQSEIAFNVAKELKAVLSNDEINQLKKISTSNPEAYDFYLMGRYFLNDHSEISLKKSEEYFKKAIASDPQYALSYSSLANCFYLQAPGKIMEPQTSFEKAKEYARKAISLDKQQAEAHAVLGAILCWGEWKWEEARKEFKIALELDPYCPLAHHYYSQLLDITRQFKAARKHIDIALKLDPLNFYICMQSSLFYYHQEKFEESLKACDKAGEIHPERAKIYWRHFDNHYRLGNQEGAIIAMEKMLSAYPETEQYASKVRDVCAQSGLNGIISWRNEIELSKPNPSPIIPATFYAILNDHDKALDWLEISMKERWVINPLINSAPDLNVLRQYPRFQSIIKQLGLSDYQKRDDL